MESNLKEVYFGEWCPKCAHLGVAEELEPCFDCLAEPANVDSHKPVKWVEGKVKKSDKEDDDEEYVYHRK